MCFFYTCEFFARTAAKITQSVHSDVNPQNQRDTLNNTILSIELHPVRGYNDAALYESANLHQLYHYASDEFFLRGPGKTWISSFMVFPEKK